MAKPLPPAPAPRTYPHEQRFGSEQRPTGVEMLPPKQGTRRFESSITFGPVAQAPRKATSKRWDSSITFG